jgi:hypothetical protein
MLFDLKTQFHARNFHSGIAQQTSSAFQVIPKVLVLLPLKRKRAEHQLLQPQSAAFAQQLLTVSLAY